MKKIKIFLSSIMIVLSVFLLIGCSGDMNVDYDLSTSGNNFTYNTVENMKGTPNNFINKTFKIRGKLRSNGGAYHYMTGYDSTNCCEWTLEVRAVEDLEYPDSSKNIIALGTYRSSKVNGRTSYYLEVSQFM